MTGNEKTEQIVYISCVEEVRYSFVSHLSDALSRKGIDVFVDSDDLRSEEAQEMVKRARVSVMVLPGNLELITQIKKIVKVLECQRNDQVVVPVLYGIITLEDDWRRALQKISGLSQGHQSRKECTDSKLVEEIARDVYEKLYHIGRIGIYPKLLEIEQMVCKQQSGIRCVGIWGMPGIGKTTLAKAVFDQMAGAFDAHCFIEDYDKAIREKGLYRVLEEQFLKEKPGAGGTSTKLSLLRDKLNNKKVLVVLDGVCNPLVAESFLKGFDWFGPESLIVITSRDKQVFRLCRVNQIYKIQGLNEKEALQLFSLCSSINDMAEQNLRELSMEVIEYANGNPLALTIYGKELKGKKELSEMQNAFLFLKRRPPSEIVDVVKSSYDTLSDSEKNIFLDIACFFRGEYVDYVMQLLEGCDFFPHVGVDVLVDKCLVTFSEKLLQMHNLIQDVGREIINGETVHIERRRRLWEPWSIKYLLEDNELKTTFKRAQGTEDIEGIFLDTSNLGFDVKSAAFKNMLSLRLLKIYSSNSEIHPVFNFPNGVLHSLPNELRLLHWENYPLQFLPKSFVPMHLVEINMPYSQLQKLWDGTKNLEMLRTIRLCHSQQLVDIGDLLKAQNLEVIDLQGCTRLQNFPATGQLLHLQVVNLSGCTEIKSFPEVPPNIETLHLQGTGITGLPLSIVKPNGGEIESLLAEFQGLSDALKLERVTNLLKSSSSSQDLGKLICLDLKDCSRLRSLPNMVNLEFLKVLDLSGCSELETIQCFPRNLTELYIAGTAVREVPQLPQSLELLNAHGCVSLKSIGWDSEQLPMHYMFSNCFDLSPQAVNNFIAKALANVERMSREHLQELNEGLAFSLCTPSHVIQHSTLDLQLGSSVMTRLAPSSRSTLVGFAMLVEVAFSKDFYDATGFGVSCVCRWKNKEGRSHRLERIFPFWAPGESILKLQKDHIFVFCDVKMRPTTGEGNDPDILADLVVFEFFPVNKQRKHLDDSCTVTRCKVYVIDTATGNTNLKMSSPCTSSDPVDFSVNDGEEVLRVIYDDLQEIDKALFLYTACLFNDEDVDLVAPLIPSIDMDISYGLNALANRSLIYVSSNGEIGMNSLLRKMGKDILHRQSMLSGSSQDSTQDVSMASSSSHSFIYDVFLSFNGRDVRKTFLSHLLKEFKSKGITTFIDTDIIRGQLISDSLARGMKESRMSIVVLSKNYVSSIWNLNELVEIVNRKADVDQKVIPIFYDVYPSNVKKQTGEFGMQFKQTCKNRTEDEKQQWCQALTVVSNLHGYFSGSWENEADMIEEIANGVLKTLNITASKDFGDIVEDHISKMNSLMCLESEEVRMVGIWGPPGIGKTTIARALYSQLARHFRRSIFVDRAFLDRAMENSTRAKLDDYDTKLCLQARFLSAYLGQKLIKVHHLGMLKESLNDQKVLIILDDVDDQVLLDALARDTGWFGSGSRIIVTTRDKHLLKSHGITNIYEVDIPSKKQALQMFCQSAFRQNSPPDGFMDLASEVAQLAGNLPLVLSILGLSLRGKSEKEWMNMLPQLRDILEQRVKKTLGVRHESGTELGKSLPSLSPFPMASYSSRNWSTEDAFLSRTTHVKNALSKISLQKGQNPNPQTVGGGNPKPQQSLSRAINNTEPEEQRLKQLAVKLDVECNDDETRIVGLVGMPGIGKTDLANKLFLKLQTKMLRHMFIEFDSQKPKDHESVWLQKEDYPDLSFADVNALDVWKNLLSEKKVVIVFDNVSDKKQIEPLLGNCDWIKKGSRIIITTRDKSLIEGLVKSLTKALVCDLYEVPGLNEREGLELFRAQICSNLEGNFMEMSRKFVDYAGGNSLALVQFGKELKGKEEDQWKARLGTLTQVSNDEIRKVLKKSFENDLDEKQKDAILDVVCFFRSEDENCVTSLLDSVDPLSLEAGREVRDLADKFFIHISNGRVEMHDLLFTMGKELVEATTWKYWMSTNVLRNKEGREMVRGIVLDMTKMEEMPLDNEAFIGMSNLRYLKVYYSLCSRNCEAKCKLNLPDGLEFPKDNIIRYLHWVNFSGQELPSDFEPKNLIDLRLPYSKITSVWNRAQVAPKLKWVDLSHSSKLISLSGLSDAPNLLRLNLEGCTSLKELPEEMQKMNNLDFLNLRGCTSLLSLPTISIDSLKTLILSGCSNLRTFEVISKNLETLYLNGTAIDGLPQAIGDLHGLNFLNLKDCKNLATLPDCLWKMGSLQELKISRCSNLKMIPDVKEIMENLRVLLLDGTSVTELPRNIFGLSFLRRLCLSRNDQICSLEFDMGQMLHLKWLELKYCKNLKSLLNLPSNLQCLNAHGCTSLRTVANPLALRMPTELMHSTFIFTNCYELEQVSKNAIVSYVQKKSKLMSNDRYNQDFVFKSLIGTCFPGCEVPAWFDHQALGSLLKLELPRDWNEGRFIGIALCVVVSFKEYKDQHNSLQVKCTCEFTNVSLGPGSFIVGGWSEQWDEPHTIESDHVFIGYTSWFDLNKRQHFSSAHAVSLRFEVTNGTSEVAECEVMKCGFSLVHEPDEAESTSWEANPSMQNNRYDQRSSYITAEDDADCPNVTPTSEFNRVDNIIRYLHWVNFSGQELPSDFEPKNLIDLRLPYSQITSVWNRAQVAPKLKRVDLSHSSKLISLSGLSDAPNLLRLNLEGCTSLKELPEEMQKMNNLDFLNLRGCTSLLSLPAISIDSLKTLILSGCSNLRTFEVISKNLETLYLNGTAIDGLPQAIGDLHGLNFLNLKDCKNLATLPYCLWKMRSLQELKISRCSKLKKIPDIKEIMENLRVLLLDGTSITEIPSNISGLSFLRRLCLSRNDEICSLQFDMGQMFHLKWLELRYCKNLTSLPSLPPNLQCLNAHGCTSLRTVTSPLAILMPTELMHSTFIFTNCQELEQVSKNAIISYVQKKSELMSEDRYNQHFVFKSLIGTCFPGCEVPTWFNQQALGSVLKLELPRDWNEGRVIGIALSVVISFKEYKDQHNSLLVKCTCEFTNVSLSPKSFIVGGWSEQGDDESHSVESDHVFIGYTTWFNLTKRQQFSSANEVSLRFEVTNGTSEVAECEVMKCGFSLVHEPDEAESTSWEANPSMQNNRHDQRSSYITAEDDADCPNVTPTSKLNRLDSFLSFLGIEPKRNAT